MYITAHRVTTGDGGITGINCFLHKHHCRLGVDASWDNSKTDDTVYHRPGELIDQLADISPGGNRILSYLDVITEDSTPPEAILRALKNYEPLIGTEDFPMAKLLDGVIVRFSLVLGLAGKEELEYPALSSAIASMLKNAHTGS